MKRATWHIAMCCAALYICGCSEPVTQEQLIKDAIRLRIEQWEEEQITLCHERALSKAMKYTDSLLLAQSLTSKLDSLLPIPADPSRPEKPLFREKPDSLVIRPIYDRTE
jgi:hypothetical protein